jgi:hypothetical protein
LGFARWAAGGFDDELMQPVFSIGLKGVDHTSDANMTAVQVTASESTRALRIATPVHHSSYGTSVKANAHDSVLLRLA